MKKLGHREAMLVAKTQGSRDGTWCHTAAKCQVRLCWAVPHFHKPPTREENSHTVKTEHKQNSRENPTKWPNTAEKGRESRLGDINCVIKFYISKILCYLQEIDLKHREIDNIQVKGWDRIDQERDVNLIEMLRNDIQLYKKE